MKNEIEKNVKNESRREEKELKKRLDIKEKEVNELKAILNTNVSIKSQMSSINMEIKDLENSKDKKEIVSYNESCNNRKKYNFHLKKILYPM